MKKFILVVVMLLSTQGAMAQFGGQIPEEHTVEQVLVKQTNQRSLKIEADSFIPNIMGYACPVPAINVPKWFVWGLALSHNQGGDFGVKEAALRIDKPDMRFCHFPSSPQEIFGEEYQVGSTVELSVTLTRSIVTFVGWDQKTHRGIHETLTTELFGQKLISQGFVSLDPVENN